ncbi:MAG: YdbH domain-containing protein [Deltaproteobacteria bacterium]|nr:YdbH domain-containing protein [Deltaproteobacteria bacterium]
MFRLRQCTLIIGLLLLFGLALLGTADLLLPGLIETRILPQLAGAAGVPSLRCRINHVGFSRASAGPLTLGEESDPSLSIEQIVLQYTPASIQKREVTKIILSGVSIKTDFSKETRATSGRKEPRQINARTRDDDNAAAKKDETEAKNSNTEAQIPPLPFAELLIERSFFIVASEEKSNIIPFSLHLKKTTDPQPGPSAFKGTLQLGAPASPTTINLTLTPTAEILSLTGQGQIQLNNLCRNLFTMPQPLNQQWNLNAEITSQKGWQATLTSASNNSEWEIERQGVTIHGQAPTISIEARGLNGKGELKWQAAIEHAALRTGDSRCDCEAVQAAGRLVMDSTPTGRTLNATTRINLAGSRLRQPDFELELPELFLEGEFHKQGSSAPAAEAQLHFAQGSLQAPAHNLKLKNLSGNLPLTWPRPPTAAADKGHFACREIYWQHLALGSFAATLEQKEKAVILQGQYECAPVKGLKMVSQGQCGLDKNGTLQAGAKFKIPVWRPEKPLSLDIFSSNAGSAAATTFFDGGLSAEGAFTYSDRGLQAAATLTLTDALLRNDDRKISLSGINCRLNLPELPALRSAPQQNLTFERLTAGNLSLPGGALTFQIEGDKTLLIENSRFSWCDGNIETKALRISPRVDHYQTTLYCDRLKLTKLLHELGRIEAQGEGSVNGRIPLSWENGKISFDDGFLYSTPGQSGTVQIRKAELLGAGGQSDDPQLSQLDLTREALKDFQYQWVKMRLNSEAEELILNLQFDGKPNQPLPFIYKEELGGFIRVTADHPGSNFQGISLDLNLRLPLNRILQYKDLPNLLK